MLDLTKIASFEDIVDFLARQSEKTTNAFVPLKLPLDLGQRSMEPVHEMDAFDFHDLRDFAIPHPVGIDTSSFKPVVHAVESTLLDKSWFMEWLSHDMEHPVSRLALAELDRTPEILPVVSHVNSHDPFNGFDKIMETFDHRDTGSQQSHLELHVPTEKAFIIADDTSFFL